MNDHDEIQFRQFPTPWSVAPDPMGTVCIMDSDGDVLFRLVGDHTLGLAQLVCKVMNAYAKVLRWLKEDRND